MSWSEAAPTLPSGSAWGEMQIAPKWAHGNDNLQVQVKGCIARGSGSTVYMKVIYQAYRNTGSDTVYSEPMHAVVNGEDGPSKVVDSGIYQDAYVWKEKYTCYWTGTAAAGAKITLHCVRYGSSTGDTTFTVPGTLALPIYLNVGGTVHQVEKAYLNVGGTVKECEVYLNVGGTIKQLK